MLWRLKKALYGMRSSPRRFYKLLHRVLTDTGYKSLASKPIFYMKGTTKINCDVDDPLMAGKSEDHEVLMSTLEKQMSFKRGDVVSCGEETRYLGKLCWRTKTDFKVQVSPNYFFDALELAGLTGCKRERVQIQADCSHTRLQTSPFGTSLFLQIKRRCSDRFLEHLRYTVPSESIWTMMSRSFRASCRTRVEEI